MQREKEKVWDDVVAGPCCTDGGLFFFALTSHRARSHLRNLPSLYRDGEKFQRSLSMPISSSPVSPTAPMVARNEHVLKGVSNGGSNLNLETARTHFIDKPNRFSPPTTGAFEWLYDDNGDGKTKNIHMK